MNRHRQNKARTRWLRIALLAGLLAHSAPGARLLPERPAGTQDVTRIEVPAPAPEPEPARAAPLIWQTDLERALVDAAAQYRSVLLFMSSPNCVYCRRLKDQVFTEPDIRELLSQFTLMEIDVQSQPAMGQHFALQGVPALLVLSSDGRERGRVVGYVHRDDLKKILLSALGQAEEAFRSTTQQSIDSLLDQETIRDEQWEPIVAALGERDLRDPIRERLRMAVPFPRKPLADLLSSPRLAVRLGALELLEEAAGDDFGLDPWLVDPADPKHLEALQAWQRWAAEESTTNQTFAALTSDQIASYLRDLTSDKRERYLRAMRQLERAGPQAREAIEAFAAAQPDLSPGARRRLQEVKLTLLIPAQGGLKPETVAHRLVFGNLDAQLLALRDLGRMGRPALPALQLFLADENALIRETALEAACGAGTAAIPLLLERAEAETDPDVIIALVRMAGSLGEPETLPIIRKFIRHSNEDVVMAALQNTSGLDRKDLKEEFEACLKDPRWRVRAAAAEMAGKTKRRDLTPALESLLEDEEPFVRYRAIQAIAGAEGRSSVNKLSELFLREDSLKAPIIAAFAELELALPKTFITALDGKEPGLLLVVVQELKKCEERGLPLAAQLAQHRDGDVACAAIRLLSQEGAKKPEYQRQLLKILQEGDRERRLAVLQSIPVVSSSSRYGQWTSWDAAAPASAESESSGEPSALDALADAFSEPAEKPAPAVPATHAPPPAALEDVFAAFESDEAPATNAGVATGGDVSADDWVSSIRTFLESPDEELQQAAALALMKLQRTDSLDYVIRHLPDLSVGDREDLAETLDDTRRTEHLPLLQLLLRDSSETVRKAAADALVQNLAQPAWADKLFQELLREGTPLQPYEVFDWSLMSQAQQAAGQRQIRRWLPELLKPGQTPMRRQLGLLLLSYTGRRQEVNLVSPWLPSDDPWARRAALQALAAMDPPQFALRMDRIKADSSEQVRILIPLAVSKQKSDLTLYFDEQHFAKGYLRGGDGSDFMTKLNADARSNTLAITRQLTQDLSPKVRLEAMMALLSRGEPVDPQSLIATASAFSDQKAVGQRLGDYLTDHYRKLGRTYAPLLPYLKYTRANRQTRRQIEAFLSAGLSYAVTGVLARAESQNPTPTPEAFEAPPASDPARPVHLVFFEEHGCDDCAQAIKQLQLLQKTLPAVTLETHDIATQRAKTLYDALAEEFQMPQELRRLTPALFSGAGYLVRDDLAFQRLAELTVRSQGIPKEAWYPETEAPEPAAPPAPPVSPASPGRGFYRLLLLAAVTGLTLLILRWKK